MQNGLDLHMMPMFLERQQLEGILKITIKALNRDCCWVIADIHADPFLLTPHRQPANRMQERFNRSHCSTRSTVERVFGIWKKRFHVLGSEIRMKPGKACRIITACAVLHNIATLRLEPDVDGEQEEDIQPVIPAYVGRQDGQGIRDHIAINFFS
ncbi:HARBI1 [Mytilus edulis]|uniref:HARBI1 n=1 Tax=Mytilus edulis TaxID=6550 RepID=A0A8S3QCX9_MYTED|nr:HARBI1 [Mytilus edulis]